MVMFKERVMMIGCKNVLLGQRDSHHPCKKSHFTNSQTSRFGDIWRRDL